MCVVVIVVVVVVVFLSTLRPKVKKKIYLIKDTAIRLYRLTHLASFALFASLSRNISSIYIYIYLMQTLLSWRLCQSSHGKLHGISKRFLQRLKPMTPPQQTNPDHGSVPQAPTTLQPTPSDDRSIASIVRAADTSPLRSAGVKCRCVPPRVLDVETQHPRGQ